MSHSPPVPGAAQSPYPLAEPAHSHAASPPVASSTPSATTEAVTAAREAVTPLTDKVAPLAEKAKDFVKARPYAAAALFGTLLLATVNTLRGR